MPSSLRHLALAALLFSSACSPDASGRFTIDGVTAHEECLGAVFPFEPFFLTLRERADATAIFLQSRGGAFQYVDVIHFEIFEAESIETGVPYTLDPITMEDSRIVSGVELGESCPELFDSLTIDGTLEFDSFSREVDGLVRGTVDGSLRSLRTGEDVASSIAGDFEFTVQVGQPFEEFRN